MKKSVITALVSAIIAIPNIVIPTVATSAEDYTKLFTPIARGDQSTQSTYFVMTDRFADGDTSNNGDGYIPENIGYWHGGDFKGLTSRLDYIQSMGFTSMWITPPVVQQSIQGSSAAYHGYWALDFMHIDSHLGSEKDFKDFVDAAHQRGLKVIMDVVANHTADVIKYKGVDAYIPVGKENAKNPAFLNTLSNYHNAGDSTFEGESALVGDFFGLDDLATEKPEVVKGFIDIWSYYITHFNIDGFRIDTFKHVNPAFWKQVIPAVLKVARANGKSKFPIFGEVAEGNPDILATFVAGGQTPSVLDFGTSDQIFKFAARFGPATRLASFYNMDDLYTTASTSAYGLATFVGNHDMGRIGKDIAANSADAEQAVKKDLVAQAMLFFTRGGPITYYGDEHGMTGAGGDKAARQDMFSTQVSDWMTESRIGEPAIGSKSSFDVANPIKDAITQFNKVIAANPALRNGTQQTLLADGQLFAFARYAEGKEYVVVLNAGESERSVMLNAIKKSAAWNLLSGQCAAKPGLSVIIPALSYCVLAAAEPLSKSATTKVSAPSMTSSNDSALWLQVSTQVNAPGYNEVTFLAREKGGKWKSLGTSDHTTFETGTTPGGLYRVFLHPEDYKKRTSLEIIAILKNSDGKIVASPIKKASIN